MYSEYLCVTSRAFCDFNSLHLCDFICFSDKYFILQSHIQQWCSGFLATVHWFGIPDLSMMRKLWASSRITVAFLILVTVWCPFMGTVDFMFIFWINTFLLFVQHALITEVHLSTRPELAHWKTWRELFA